eukprot:TRINITY_DN14168_c0_g1_i4.p1 TRINITY_DN14168_c0_g1~~TRINITY_DN14168_c0_g1_i4.p1  ORF type:complete len:244 (+),score=44.46 TRINITY_DN14168_c0_g1_i4:56-787(+)
MIFRRAFCSLVGNAAQRKGLAAVDTFMAAGSLINKRQKLFGFLVAQMGYVRAADMLSMNQDMLIGFVRFLAATRREKIAAQIAAEFKVRSLLPAEFLQALPQPERRIYRRTDKFSSFKLPRKVGEVEKASFELSSFGLKPEVNVHFISSKTPAIVLEMAAAHLRSLLEDDQSALAFDTESMMPLELAPSRLAILQVATTKAIYVIDMLSFDPSHHLSQALVHLFESPKVRKLCAGSGLSLIHI